MKEESGVESRSARKSAAIMDAATAVFLEKGYDGASMDDVAAKAAVSKPTVYRYFSDKEELFAEIVLATTGQIDDLVHLVVETMTGQTGLEKGLTVLARRFITALMQPRVLRLRRLVIANAERFPDVARSWYEQGFERVLTTLANTFRSFAGRKLLYVGDPLLAANHFVGLLLWIPINRAMFTGDHDASPDELERYAVAAVRTFLAAYAQPQVGAPKRLRNSASHKG